MPKTIRDYITNTIDHKLAQDICELTIKQLCWSIRAEHKTPERSVVPNLTDFSTLEVRRGLSRLHCLELLTDHRLVIN